MTSTRRSVTAITAAAALALGVLPAAFTTTSILASGEEPATVESATGAGSVVLSTTSGQGTVTWRDQTQTFTGGQQCEITPSEDSDPVLDITGTIIDEAAGVTRTAVAGFRDGLVGVFEALEGSPTNASQCFRIDAGSFTEFESLNLALDPNGDYGDEPFSEEPLRAERATVTAVATSKSGTLEVAFLDGSGDAVETQEYTWSRVKPGNVIEDIPALVRSEPGALFSGVSLTATAGSFSLTGATFDLVSQADAEFCNGDVLPEPGATVKYLGTVSGEENCFNVQLEAKPRLVRFVYPLDLAPADAQFLYTIDWTITPEGSEEFTPEVTLDTPKIDFELGATNETPLDFCPDALYTIEDGVRTSGPAVTDFDAFNEDDDTFRDMEPADGKPTDPEGGVKQFACVHTRSAPVVSVGTIEIRDAIFVIGDAKMRL